MTLGADSSELALVLAPSGRDAQIAKTILAEAGLEARVCAHLGELVDNIAAGAGLAIIAEEALSGAPVGPLAEWVKQQPPWSDFPLLLLSPRGGGLERNPAAQRISAALGNVSFLERPFHPTTLVSAARAALRARRRQYEARERLEEIRRAEALLERRVAERTAELEASNRQLAAQIIERERAEAALRQAQRLEAVGQLTSGVAHDFNNLLTVVIGNIEQLQKRITDPALLRRLSLMLEAAKRGAKLTAQMLAFSRRQKLEPRPVDLNETIRVMDELLHSAIGGSVHIEPPDLAPDLWTAMIDPTQIELVILNLAINARDAMEVGGSLKLRTANVVMGHPQKPEEPAAGEYVMVSVQDTGTGMSEEVLARAFEPFFTTKEVGRGSGLGLSQVYGLAKQSGGGVTIETKLGVGTTINVFLPKATGAVQSEHEAEGLTSARSTGEKVVMIVDDDEAVREVTAGIVADQGYLVLEAGSGGAALELFERHSDISAVILDFAMPGMNGLDLAREIRSRRPETVMLFATGFADAENLADIGKDDIVRKPFLSSELAQKLTRKLQAAARS